MRNTRTLDRGDCGCEYVEKRRSEKDLPYTDDIIAKCLFIGDDENSSYIRNSNCEVALDNGKKM